MTELRTPDEAGVVSFPTTAPNINRCNYCGSRNTPIVVKVGGNEYRFCTDEHRNALLKDQK